MLRAFVRAFDAFLRRREGIFEFEARPEEQLFRLQVSRLQRDVKRPDFELPAGAKILSIHLWNEHVPPIPVEGAELAWGLRVQRMLVASFRAIARQMQSDPRLAGVTAVHAVTAIFGAHDGSGGEKLMRRMGFFIYPCRRPLGRCGELWENAYSWLLMYVFNPVSVRRRQLWRLERSEMWMLAEEFLRRYGAPTG